MQSRQYTFGELRQKLMESASEFRPKIAAGVRGKEKSDSEKTYREIADETKKMAGDAKAPQPKEKGKSVLDQYGMSANNMGHLQYDGEVSKKFKDRAKSALKGYSSDLEEKNHAKEEHANAEFNDDIARETIKTANDVKKTQDKQSEIGLTNAQREKESTHLHSGTIGESKKMTTLKFKVVQFISESQMLAHVPDEYKKEGNRFGMQDCKGNKYIVEWHKEPEVEKVLNESKTAAELDRIKYLFGYKGKLNKTTNASRMNENRETTEMLDKVRKLMKS